MLSVFNINMELLQCLDSTDSCCMPIAPIPKLGGFVLSHSCCGHFLDGLLQFILCGAALEAIQKLQPGPQCSNTCSGVYSYYITWCISCTGFQLLSRCSSRYHFFNGAGPGYMEPLLCLFHCCVPVLFH